MCAIVTLGRLYESGDKCSGLRTDCAKTSKPVFGLTQYLDMDARHILSSSRPPR